MTVWGVSERKQLMYAKSTGRFTRLVRLLRTSRKVGPRWLG